MKYLLKFITSRTPSAGKELPEYYRDALTANEVILIAHFLLSFFLLSSVFHVFAWAPLVFCAVTALCLVTNGRIHVRVSLYAYGVIVMLWCAWQTRMFGWGCGAHQLLVPVLMLCFFHLFESPVAKIVDFTVLVTYYISMFALSLRYPPLYSFDQTTGIVLQTVNILVLFVLLAIDCTLLSANSQDTERRLRLDNQELHKEAGTDPLTQLPNRRAMLDEMQRFQKESPEEQFCIAIADIDFFKKVNDTYGHACGDYTLRTLAALYRAHSVGRYRVCRWGGEEFCFFIPGKNLDEAGVDMVDLEGAVRRMHLHFEGIDFTITTTIGVAENDFRSPLKDIWEEADRKLYQGKVAGRDRVVI